MTRSVTKPTPIACIMPSAGAPAGTFINSRQRLPNNAVYHPAPMANRTIAATITASQLTETAVSI